MRGGTMRSVLSPFTFLPDFIARPAALLTQGPARLRAILALLLFITVVGFMTGCGSSAGGNSGNGGASSDMRTEFWVSPNGSDASAGSQSQPFLTMERARDAIRSLDQKRREGQIVVYLKGGTYRLERPFTLETSDSGRNGNDIVYCAAPGEHPVISGSVQVQNWSLHDEKLKIYRAYAGHRQSRQLYVNGQRAIRARTEPYPAGFRPTYFYLNTTTYPMGIPFIPTDLNPVAWKDPATWTNVGDIEAVIITQWKMMSVPLQSVTRYPGYTPDPILQPDLKTGLITLQEPGWTNANVFLSSETYEPGLWSFWQVTRFENAYEFLDEPGEFYLDKEAGWLYYIPRSGEDITSADVELPVQEVLLEGRGELEQPVSNIRFEGLTFCYATWLSPSSNNGYVADQSGFCLVGSGHTPDIIGHDQNVVRTAGNVRFRYAQAIGFRGNLFTHLGGAGLDFDTGSKGNTIVGNLFTDISAAAIQLGGVSPVDHHPVSPEQVTENNEISNNLIRHVGREFVDAAGIFVGFTRNTLISNNTIIDVPWSGIAMGWGWGLLDEGMYPGIPDAVRGQWGTFTTPTPNSGNRILNNRFQQFLNVVWDGGAIYTTGQQGTSMKDPLLIRGNVASGKRPQAGGNIFYTDGGSRYVILKENVSYDNPHGVTDFGPPSWEGDPLPYPAYSILNNIPYGSDIGGCRTYGYISYAGNYWLSSSFFDICPFIEAGISYPVNLSYTGNHIIQGVEDVPQALLDDAGVQNFPQALLDAAGEDILSTYDTRPIAGDRQYLKGAHPAGRLPDGRWHR
jgi:hypothetical protein